MALKNRLYQTFEAGIFMAGIREEYYMIRVANNIEKVVRDKQVLFLNPHTPHPKRRGKSHKRQ